MDAVTVSADAILPAPDEDCYAPTQNLNSQLYPDAYGCECEGDDEDLCAATGRGERVILTCDNGHWNADVDEDC